MGETYDGGPIATRADFRGPIASTATADGGAWPREANCQKKRKGKKREDILKGFPLVFILCTIAQ